MCFEIRCLDERDIPAFRQTFTAAFGHDAELDNKENAARFAAIFDRSRMFPAFDGDQIVATGGDFGLVVTVPGRGQVPMSGLTVVSVRPTHTRQGVLTAMMREHFDRARNREEPLGGLWASEVPIYGRYGYGPATLMHKKELDTRKAGRGGSEPGITVALVDAAEAERLLPAAYQIARPTRPGMLERSSVWWKYQHFYDPEKSRGGASALRFAVAIQDGDSVGYVTYRQKSNWDLLSEGEIRITEMMPATDAAYRALWYYITSIDLFPIVKWWNTPADEPLDLLIRDGRAVATTSVSDGLWIRLIDVPEALTSRTYATDGSLVVRVVDEFCAWNDGTYRFDVIDGVAQCERVVADPSVTMSVSTLGALYLGGRDALALARAGLIEGDSDSVALLGSIFRHSPDPWCPEIF